MECESQTFDEPSGELYEYELYEYELDEFDGDGDGESGDGESGDGERETPLPNPAYRQACCATCSMHGGQCSVGSTSKVCSVVFFVCLVCLFLVG